MLFLDFPHPVAQAPELASAFHGGVDPLLRQRLQGPDFQKEQGIVRQGVADLALPDIREPVMLQTIHQILVGVPPEQILEQLTPAVRHLGQLFPAFGQAGFLVVPAAQQSGFTASRHGSGSFRLPE